MPLAHHGKLNQTNGQALYKGRGTLTTLLYTTLLFAFLVHLCYTFVHFVCALLQTCLLHFCTLFWFTYATLFVHFVCTLLQTCLLHFCLLFWYTVATLFVDFVCRLCRIIYYTFVHFFDTLCTLVCYTFVHFFSTLMVHFYSLCLNTFVRFFGTLFDM